MKIFAIGGRASTKPKVFEIDTELVRLSGKKKPTMLLDMTPSPDPIFYEEFLRKLYEDQLDCNIESIHLIDKKYTKKELEKKIFSSDILYVSGGNTLKMMNAWKSTGFDQLILSNQKKELVLAGSSAGSICWFRYGHSDSMRHYNPNKWDYIRVSGLNMINATVCPHYNFGDRKKEFHKLIEKRGGMGIALDEGVAIEIVDNKFKIVLSKKNTNVYKVYKKEGKVISIPLEQRNKLRPIKFLSEKN